MAVSDHADTDYLTDTPAVTARLSGSRMAVIALTDRLARRAMPGLILIIATSVALALYHLFNAQTIGAALRCCVWLVMILTPVWITAQRLRRYRMGGLIASRPLTWRAGHTAGLGLISMALGCGALMLTAAMSQISAAMTLLILTLLVLMMALGNIAHVRSALAAALPGLTLIAFAASLIGRAQGLSGYVLMTLPCLVLMAAMWGILQHRHLVRQALEQHPRHEVLAISARRKKTTSAYNPFRMKAGQAPRRDATDGKSSVTPHPYGKVKLYRPAER